MVAAVVLIRSAVASFQARGDTTTPSPGNDHAMRSSKW